MILCVYVGQAKLSLNQQKSISYIVNIHCFVQ